MTTSTSLFTVEIPTRGARYAATVREALAVLDNYCEPAPNSVQQKALRDQLQAGEVASFGGVVVRPPLGVLAFVREAVQLTPGRTFRAMSQKHSAKQASKAGKYHFDGPNWVKNGAAMCGENTTYASFEMGSPVGAVIGDSEKLCRKCLALMGGK